MEEHFIKTSSRRRADREVPYYKLLNDLTFAGAPRYYGRRTISTPIGSKQLVLERMQGSLYDIYSPSEEQVLAHAANLAKRRISHAHFSKSDPPMRHLPLTMFWDYAYQLAAIMLFLHAHAGIAHRDLKPENICLDSEGYLRVIDFEMASYLMASESCRFARTRQGQFDYAEWSHFRGTRKYAPPEMMCERKEVEKRLGGYPYGPQCDSWCYGVVLLEMFSGYDLESERCCYYEQRHLDGVVEELIEARPTLLLTQREADSASQLSRLLRNHCLQRNWRDRSLFHDIIDDEAFQTFLTPARRRFIRQRFGGVVSVVDEDD